MNLKEIGVNTRNWVDATKDWDYWRAFIYMASNLKVTYEIELDS